jgi:uncharacterized protein
MARKKAAAATVAARPIYREHGQVLYDMWRDPTALQRHLDAGHSIDELDSQSTLLCLACAPISEALSKGSDAQVKQLLQAGADPNLETREGTTPLMCASALNIANCLLDHGADIERVNNKGTTALEQASCWGRSDVVKVLLKRGAVTQLLKISESGHTPLSAAVTNRHEETTLLLLQRSVLQAGFDINHSRLALNQLLLCCAATVGLLRVVEFALEHSADPNITGPNGPPLTLAVQHGHHSIVDLLCKKGANMHTRFGLMNSLDEAIIRGDLKIVKILIRHGVDVNVNADSSQSPAIV